MRKVNKLTPATVKAISTPGLHADGLNLYLQVGPTGNKAWLFRYMIGGKAKSMGLGPVHTVTLAMARDKATEARRKLLEGIDPVAERDSAKQASAAAAAAAAAKLITFKECAKRYIAAKEAGWKNAKHADQWGSTLEAYVYPVFGHLAVNEVDVGLVLQALEPIWTTKTETASRVRGRIESVLDWATARGYRHGDNPARWRGHLDKLLSARPKSARVNHHSAMPYSDVAAFMVALRAMEGVSPKALEFAIHTATRTGETVGARWSEIDLAARMWTIPGNRMKAGKEHRVPLSARAIEILKSLPREDDSDFVFIGDRKGKPLSNMALLMTLRRMGRDDVTVHGFRSTFRDWAAEQTAYPNELVEMALAHTISDKTEAAYRRGDMVEKRRRLMQDWTDYCARVVVVADNVTPIRA